MASDKNTMGVMAIGQFVKAICDHKKVRIYSNDGLVDRIYIYDDNFNVYHEEGFTYGAQKIIDFLGLWTYDIYNMYFNYEILN